MDWIVYGDDWAAHRSTTQYLVANLPADDRVLWVNSLGMRGPGFNARDFSRLFAKFTAVFRPPPKRTVNECAHPMGPTIRVIWPRALPWHGAKAARAVSRVTVGRQLRSAMTQLSFRNPAVLVSNPVAVWYLDPRYSTLGYLRLDDYAELPGVDARMVGPAEALLYASCDLIFATARQLFPADATLREKTRYLPQGVDVEHFSTVPITPPRKRCLGFFGLLAEWLDYDLIEATARLCPDWTFEFIGPIRNLPAGMRNIPNVRLLPAVPYEDLPNRLQAWDAAWIPFRVNKLTLGVNPLKLREYLAAGLATLSTPLPEAMALDEGVRVVNSAEEVRDELQDIFSNDTPASRERRRFSVAAHHWKERAADMRRAFLVANS